MIKVLITKEENKFKLLEVKGHSNSAECGHDLICAAVSAVVTGGFNAIEQIKDYEFVLSEGYAMLQSKDKVSSHDEVVIETVITQLKTIAEEYPKFVKIKNL